jgi:hypothetical protein
MAQQTQSIGTLKQQVTLGPHPDDRVDTAMSEGRATKYYWVGVEVVQKKNVRVEVTDTDEKIYHYPESHEQWSPPTYLVIHKTFTMPPLGESVYLTDWEARRLHEIIPEGCLLTERQGGAAVAEYLKEQIKNGVPLVDMDKGSFEHVRNVSNAQDVLSELTDDEIAELLKERGVKLDTKKKK